MGDNMQILVTGALGHIGSRLIRELPDLLPRTHIHMIDNFLTQRYCSLFNLPDHGRYTFTEADIADCNLDSLLTGIDVVIHLAAITDATSSFAQKDEVEEINHAATARLASACAKHGCRMIFISTTSVYGTQAEVVDESCTVDELRPQSPYAEAKLKAEQMLQKEGAQQGLKFVILRFGTIFGISPGMRFHTAVNKFSWQACMGQPITVWKTAMDQKRPYLDLSDAIRALACVIERDIFDCAVYNVLTTNATVREIVESIRSFFPELEVELVDSRIMNQLSYTVSNRKFAELGFQFEGDLAQSIEASVNLLRNAMNGAGGQLYRQGVNR